MAETHNRTCSQGHVWLRAHMHTHMLEHTLTRSNTHAAAVTLSTTYFLILSACVSSALSSASFYIKEQTLKFTNHLGLLLKKQPVALGINQNQKYSLLWHKVLFICTMVSYFLRVIAFFKTVCLTVIPVSLLLLPVVDLFEQLYFQRATFYWLEALFGNDGVHGKQISGNS